MKLYGLITTLLIAIILIFVVLQGLNPSILRISDNLIEYSILAAILIFGLPWALMSKKEKWNGLVDGFKDNIFESMPRLIKITLVIALFMALYFLWFKI